MRVFKYMGAFGFGPWAAYTVRISRGIGAHSLFIIIFSVQIIILSPNRHRSNGDLELLDPELHSPELLRCMWEDAITDITLVR